MLEHKCGNISETRKDRLIEEKLVWRAYRKSLTNALSNGTIPYPYGLPFPRLGVRNPSPKLQSLLFQEWLKLGTSNLADIFTRSTRTQAPLTFWKFGTRSSATAEKQRVSCPHGGRVGLDPPAHSPSAPSGYTYAYG